MFIGIFTDKQHQPMMQEVLAAIGSQRALWEKLIRFVAENYRSRSDFRFYGKNYGWAVRFRVRGKAFLSMYPGKDSFTAQIVLGQDEIEKTSSLALGDNVRRILKEAHAYPEGRWIFIGVDSERELNDVQQLLVLKFRPSPQPR
jgi:hypothetical protein